MIARPGLSGLALQRLAQGNERIVVVGASGWIGQAALEALSDALGEAFGHRVCCFGSSARKLRLRSGLEVPLRSLDDVGHLPPAPTVLLHLAFLTKDKVGLQSDADYAEANRRLSRTVVDALDPIGVRGIFIASSGAAYLADAPEAAPAMRLYGSLKREQEATFVDWARASAGAAVITRIFNLSGPYINKHEHYALAAFINDALAGRPIVIKARRPVFRSYVAIRELMSIVLGSLLHETQQIVSFDTAGDSTYEMSELAEIVANVIGSKGGIERGEIDETTEDRYLGSRDKYARKLEEFSISPVNLSVQVADTAEYIVSLGKAETCSKSGE